VIRLATRGSALALAQAQAVATRLQAGGARVELLVVRTEGDRRAEARLAAIGGKGLFVREIEEALLRGDADVAVHSLKDLPAELPTGLMLAVFPEREDPRDTLVTRAPGALDALPRGAHVGSSSPRRRAIALSLRPDLAVEPIRGNVDTRLGKLASGAWDAILLAAAGLRRLGIAPPHATPLAPDVFVPAVGQGALGIEARADDAETLAALRPLDTRPRARACWRSARSSGGSAPRASRPWPRTRGSPPDAWCSTGSSRARTAARCSASAARGRPRRRPRSGAPWPRRCWRAGRRR
jgi:hydroxymethylbilane synthase